MDHRSYESTSLEIYHGVPDGWNKEELISRYYDLGGKGSIVPSEATEPGAPSWLPDRYNWLQYRATLHKIADGIKQSDLVCIELAIQYIELDYFGSYSGYIRARLARLLKNARLTQKQKIRILNHINYLRNNNQTLPEFKEYIKLEKRINDARNA